MYAESLAGDLRQLLWQTQTDCTSGWVSCIDLQSIVASSLHPQRFEGISFLNVGNFISFLWGKMESGWANK